MDTINPDKINAELYAVVMDNEVRGGLIVLAIYSSIASAMDHAETLADDSVYVKKYNAQLSAA